MYKGLIGCRTKRSRAALGMVVVLALLATGLGAPTAVGRSSSTAAAAVPTPATAALAASFTREATTSELSSLMKIFAANGIATVGNGKTGKATAPLVVVNGTVRLRFTEGQVQGMADQVADHGGATGETIDQADRLPAKDPPVAYLLAAWASKARTSGAVAVRKILGAQDWRRADRIVFPSAVLALFVTDVINADPARGKSSAAVVSAALVPEGLSNGCSTASDFVQSVLQTVFNALQLSSPSGTGLGAAVGGFFTGIWNGALGLVQKGLQGVVTTLTAPVLAAIKSIAGTVAIIAQVASDLTPWSVAVIADPPEINAGGSGSFNATVNSSVGEYPPAVTDCANALGFSLPALTAAGAKATWTLGGPSRPAGRT